MAERCRSPGGQRRRPRPGFGDVPNAVVVLDAQGREVARASGSKDDVARALVDLIAERLEND